jgi:fibronectin-binding autotransporter adhesin
MGPSFYAPKHRAFPLTPMPPPLPMKISSLQPLRLRLSTRLACIALGALALDASNASTIYWDGGAATGNWSLDANWSANATAGTNSDTQTLTSGDDAVFYRAGGGNLTSSNVNATFTLGSLTFGNGQTGGVTIGGNASSLIVLNGTANYNPLAFNSGNFANRGTVGIYKQAGTGATTINAPIRLGGAQQWINDGGNALTVGGGVDTDGNTLTVAANTNSVTIQTTGVSGGGGLVKFGSQALNLSAANGYTGATVVNAGTLAVTGSINATSSVTVQGGGGTLQFNNSGNNALSDTIGIQLGGLGGGTLTVTTNETVGDLALAAGASAINAAASRFLAANAIQSRAVGATMNFGAGSGTTNFSISPTLANGIIGPWATVGTDFATLSGSTVTALAAPLGNNTESAWDTTGVDNLSINASNTLTANRAINTLRVSTAAGAVNLGLGGRVLTTNAILNGSGQTLTINGTGASSLNAAGSELVILGSACMTISARVVADNLTSSLGQLLELSNGTNSIKNFYINSSIVESKADGALGTAEGTIYILNSTANLRFNTNADQSYANKSVVIGSGGGIISSSGSLSGNRTFTLGDATHGITLNGALSLQPNSNNNNTSRGILALAGNITDGAGYVGSITTTATGATRAGGLILTGNNTFSGGVTLNGGNSASLIERLLVDLGHDNALGTGVLTLGGTNLSNVLRATGGNRSFANVVQANSDFVLSGGNRITFTGPVILGNHRTIETSNTGGTVISGSISGAFNLTKAGNETLTLSGTGNYLGTTAVNAGTMIVNGLLDASGGAITVGANATLGGNGTIDRAVSVLANGTLSPGNSPGILSTGNLTLALNANYAVEINGNGAVAGTDYDQTNVTGTVDLGGSNLVLSITGLSGGAGQLYFIIRNDAADAVTNTFAGLAQGANFTNSGIDFQISYTGNATTQSFSGGNDVVLMAMVPEPSTGLMMLAGFGCLALFRRRVSW